jgi:RimJ/RimL family protein N-acetyltransferase
MVDHMFKTMDIDRIYLNTLEWTLRAQRCFSKCGFVAYKRLKRFDHNFVTMEMFRSQWKPANVQDAECESQSTQK